MLIFVRCDPKHQTFSLHKSKHTLYETLQKKNYNFQKVSYQRSNRYNRFFDHNEKSILKLLTQKREKNSIFVSEAVATGWKEEEIKNTKTKKKQSSLFARYVSDSLSLSAVLSRFINYLFFLFFSKKRNIWRDKDRMKSWKRTKNSILLRPVEKSIFLVVQRARPVARSTTQNGASIQLFSNSITLNLRARVATR